MQRRSIVPARSTVTVLGGHDADQKSEGFVAGRPTRIAARFGVDSSPTLYHMVNYDRARRREEETTDHLEPYLTTAA